MTRCLLLAIILFNAVENFGQSEGDISMDCDTIHFTESAYIDSVAFYERKFAHCHQMEFGDSTLMLAYYVALSHYPELRNVRVKIKLKTISSTMQAQPTWNFWLFSHKKRKYQILVNTSPDYTGITYKDLSFNSLVGWIGHELAHIHEYVHQNNLALLRFVASYVFDKRQIKRTEHQADQATIRHGLGTQLLEGVNFFHKDRKVKKSYREKNHEYYLSPEEIVSEMNHLCSQR